MGINHKSSKEILIITSCLYPNKVTTDFESKIDSLDARISRYIYCVKKLKLNQFDKAYFINNSIYEVQEYPRLHDLLKLKNIEIINMKPSQYSFKRGKGFQECEMINHILSRHDSATNFFKLTGTIPLLNFSYLFKKFKKLIQINEDWVFTSKISNINKYIDTRFFYTNKKTWDIFTKHYQKFIDDKNNIYFENVFYFFCRLKKVKINLFYADIGNQIYFDGNGKRYKSSRLNSIFQKINFLLCF